MSDAGLLYLLICRAMCKAHLDNSILKIVKLKVRIMVTVLYILGSQSIETLPCLNCNTCILEPQLSVKKDSVSDASSTFNFPVSNTENKMPARAMTLPLDVNPERVKGLYTFGTFCSLGLK